MSLTQMTDSKDKLMNEKIMENLNATTLYLRCIYNCKLQKQKDTLISVTLTPHSVIAALCNADFTH
jgi:hypothetical protein